MKITTVEFTRKFNLGNFESQDIKLQADVEEGESAETVIQSLKKIALENSGKV